MLTFHCHFSLKALRVTEGEEPLPQIMVDSKAEGEVYVLILAKSLECSHQIK